MAGTPVTPRPIVSRVYVCGQAPGPREEGLGRPFAWTAGKRLFSWFEGIGLDEEQSRSHLFIGAICRCFPGKTKQGGDRVPDDQEIENCSAWMQREFELLAPELVIAVGKVAIARFLPELGPLAEVVGIQHRVRAFGREVDMIPLPHPSGASTWIHRDPGKSLTAMALQKIAAHKAWRALVAVAAG